MSIEVLPVGITCQLNCTYCYQASIRDNDPAQRYNREAVIAAIKKLDGEWSLFGGECLILPLKDVEELLALGFAKYGKTGLQTNGALITPAHIEVFKKYKTHVGISLDGPDELNDSRWAGTLDATRKQTARTQWAIKALSDAKCPPSIIITLHAGNASKDRFPKLVQWFRELDAMGITAVNPHVMELDSDADTLYLPQDELSDRLIDLWNLESELSGLRFTKFQEVLKLLRGKDDVACIWHACDPQNTAAVQAIDNTGAPSLCLRTVKDGKTWLPAEGSGHDATLIGHPGTRYHQRQLALYVTPQDDGGCKDCPYWMACLGQCPGEGEKGDWRTRSHYCLTWKKLFAEGERRLRLVGEKPFTQWANRKHMEELMYDMWVQGQSPTLATLIKQHNESVAKGMVPVKGGYHGDSTKATS
jgi:uncharacterized protein